MESIEEKSRNGCKILILETSRACIFCRDRFRSCEAAEYVENVKSAQYWLIAMMFSLFGGVKRCLSTFEWKPILQMQIAQTPKKGMLTLYKMQCQSQVPSFSDLDTSFFNGVIFSQFSYFLIFCKSVVKSYGCDTFTCAQVSCVTVSPLHLRTLPQGP